MDKSAFEFVSSSFAGEYSFSSFSSSSTTIFLCCLEAINNYKAPYSPYCFFSDVCKVASFKDSTGSVEKESWCERTSFCGVFFEEDSITLFTLSILEVSCSS